MLSDHPDEKRDQKPDLPFLFDLCAICDTGCDDISGDFKHHGLTLDLLGGISGGHGAGVLPVQFICGVIGELYSGVCAAVVIIHNYECF